MKTLLFPISFFTLFAVNPGLLKEKVGTSNMAERRNPTTYVTSDAKQYYNVSKAGSDLNETEIKNFSYGPGVVTDANGFFYDAKNPPACTSNCFVVYPKGHPKRVVGNTVSDTQYFQNLISSLTSNGKLYIYPGYYEVDQLELMEGIEIIGLYDASGTIKSAIFSGFIPLKNWTRLGTQNLWSHDYPYNIVNYDGDSQGTYTCKDPSSSVCKYAQDLVINGVLQTQWECTNVVGCVPPLSANGQWFLDRTTQPDVNPSDNFILLRTTSNPNASDARISHLRGAFKEGTKNVKIRNILFKGYTFHGFKTEDNWVVTNCTFEKNGVTGLNLSGTNVTISRNYIKENGCTGLQGTLYNSAIKFNKIENNNVGGHKPGRHAGGLKLVFSNNTVIERNYVLDNEGAGLWADVYCNGVEMHHNLIVETKNSKGLQARGIQYEMSSGNDISGKLEIHNNIIKVEGGVAGIISIYALNSQYLDIFNNTILNAQNGILVAQDSRGYSGNCANGYPECVSCTTTMEPSCDNHCITAGVNTDNSSDNHCMQQVRNIRVFYNDISVGGSGYLLSGLIVEPGLGQTTNEVGGISPSRYYDKSTYKIDFNYNKYTIPGDPRYSYCFTWGWDSNTQKSKRLAWEELNDFVDFNSCINSSCVNAVAATQTLSSEALVAFPNPFQEYISVSTADFISSNLKFKLINDRGLSYSLSVVASSSTVVRLDTSQIPKGKYVLHIMENGMMIKTVHVLKE